MAEPSKITIKRAELAAQYGSYENWQRKMALWKSEKPAVKAFRDTALKAYRDAEEARRFNERMRPGTIDPADTQSLDDLIDAQGHQTPFWMNPFVLRTLDIALIGSPESSDEWNRDTKEEGARPNEPIGVTYQDYSALGWPASAGTPIRKVTRWEHEEIMRRLKTTGLTKPGAAAPTIVKSLAELVAENEPQPAWLIEGILREAGSAMIYGPSGIGKSWCTLMIALLAAAGRGAGVKNEMTGRWILKAGAGEGVKVCLIDGEMIKADITARTRTLCRALGLHMVGNVQEGPPLDYEQLYLAMLKDHDAADARAIVDQMKARDDEKPSSFEADYEDGAPFVDLDNIIVSAKTMQDHRAEFIDLADPGLKSRLVEFCRDQGVKVLVLDNLSTLHETLDDENSATAWNPLNSLVVALKKEGVATLLVHHSNKGESGFRGSTNLATTLETIVALERVPGARKSEGAAFRIKFDKNRAGGLVEAKGKTLKLREGRWVCEVDPLDQAAQVVEMVQSLRYKTQGEIAVELGVNQATVSRSFDAAESLGLAKADDLKATLTKARALDKKMQEPVEPEDEDDGASDF